MLEHSKSRKGSVLPNFLFVVTCIVLSLAASSSLVASLGKLPTQQMQKIFSPLFISHGAPTMIIDTSIKTHQFLKDLGKKVGKPKAIVVVSAHWEASPIEVTSSTKQIYDFYGFPDEMYRIKYQPPEDEKLARRIVDMIKSGSKLDAKYNAKRGVDHGTWVPLALMYPDADVPVVQVSLQNGLDFPTHLSLGKALSPLIQEGILLIGSGGSTHNLRKVRFDMRGNKSEGWVHEFEDWLKETVELEDVEQRNTRIATVMKEHPLARTAHPREEHLAPISVICGAAGRGKRLFVEYVFNFSTAQFEFEAPQPVSAEEIQQ